MDCLSRIYSGEVNIIGIRNFNLCEQPLSGLYINDIEGMSLKTFAAITNEEHQSGYQFAKDKIINSIRLVVEDFKQFIYPFFTVNQIVEASKTGAFASPLVYNLQASLDRGVVLERSTYARLSKIFISSIDVLCAYTGASTVKIKDGNNVTELPINLVSGQIVTLYPELKCEYDEVYITMDNTSLLTAKINSKIHTKGCSTCSTPRSGNHQIENIGWNGVSEVNELYGINVNASLRCDENELICTVLDRMYFLFWIRSGMEICKEMLVSNRLNNIALFNKEKAQAIYDRLEIDYNTKFKIFADSIKKYLSTINDQCLTCNRNKHVQSRP